MLKFPNDDKSRINIVIKNRQLRSKLFLTQVKNQSDGPSKEKTNLEKCKLVFKGICIFFGYLAWYLFIGLLPYWIQIITNLMDEGPNPFRNLDYFNLYAIVYTLCLIVYAEFYSKIDLKKFLNRGLVILIFVNLGVTCLIMGHYHYITSMKSFMPFSPPKPFQIFELITPMHLIANYVVLAVLLLIVSGIKAIQVTNSEWVYNSQTKGR